MISDLEIKLKIKNLMDSIIEKIKKETTTENIHSILSVVDINIIKQIVKNAIMHTIIQIKHFYLT